MLEQSDRLIWFAKKSFFLLSKISLFSECQDPLNPKEIHDFGKLSQQYENARKLTNNGVTTLGSSEGFFYRNVNLVGNFCIEIGSDNKNNFETESLNDIKQELGVQEIREIPGEEICFVKSDQNSCKRIKTQESNHQEVILEDKNLLSENNNQTPENIRKIRIFSINDLVETPITKIWNNNTKPDYYIEKMTFLVVNQESWKSMRLKGKRSLSRMTSSIRNKNSFDFSQYQKSFSPEESKNDLLSFGKFGSSLFATPSNEIISLGGIEKSHFLEIIKSKSIRNNLEICNFVFNSDHVFWMPPNCHSRIKATAFTVKEKVFLCGGINVFSDSDCIFFLFLKIWFWN